MACYFCEDRDKDIDSIVRWFRYDKDKSDDPTGEFEKIDQVVPRNPGDKPKGRSRDIESALDWMHNNGMALDDESLPSFKKFAMVRSVPITRRSQPER